MGPKIVHKSHCALHPLQVQWCARTALFILVCGSSRECDLRLTQMALVTLQLFSRLWQYKSQAFLCTSSCPAMACMLAFFFACARCCFRRGQLLVWAIAINAIRRPPNAERTANALWAHMPPAPCAFRSGRSAAKIPCSWRSTALKNGQTWK
jgi:hypothetical protein